MCTSYYYTPLPLNLANNKQAISNTSPFRFGHYSVPLLRALLYSAIVEPRWWPCQIRVPNQKLTGGALGQGRQVGRCPPKTAHFAPQNSSNSGPNLYLPSNLVRNFF